MQPRERVWFSAESKRAGWISALSNVALFTLLAWSFRNTHSPFTALFYPMYAIALGVVAVGVLNWRRWHGFVQSMAASFQAALAAFEMALLAFSLVALFVFGRGGPVVFLLLLFYAGVALFLSLAAIFAIAVVLACGGGAVLYGLLVVMKHAARIEQTRSEGDELKPHPLAPASL